MGQQAAEALPSCPWGAQAGVAVEGLLGALQYQSGFGKMQTAYIVMQR